jgi:L-fuconolactonase
MLWAPDGIADVLIPLHEFFARHPDARLAVTHLGTPNLSDGAAFERARRVCELASYSGAYIHISGMKMFYPYPHEPLYGLIEDAVKAFGPSRLCWGSNYPVCGSRQDYVRDLHLLLDGKLPIPKNQIMAVAGGNAGRIWFGDA